MDPDLIDEDASLRRNLAALGPDGLRELQAILEAPQPYRDELLRAMLARPGHRQANAVLAAMPTGASPAETELGATETEMANEEV